MPDCTDRLKPVAVALRVYSPTGSCGNKNSPVAFEFAVYFTCVLVSTASIEAFGMAAPVGSVISPAISAVFICAAAANTQQLTTTGSSSHRFRSRNLPMHFSSRSSACYTSLRFRRTSLATTHQQTEGRLSQRQVYRCKEVVNPGCADCHRWEAHDGLSRWMIQCGATTGAACTWSGSTEGAATGRCRVNVLPSPGMLRTVRSPFIASAMLFAKGNPRPVPRICAAATEALR